MHVYAGLPDEDAEVDYKNAGYRIGRRIKKIREEHVPKMTQADLGSLLGLSANRVQQYENGARTPKFELLTRFADALGVSTMALIDPVVGSYVGLMYAFFEMEKEYGLQLKETDAGICLYFEDGSFAGNSRQVNMNLKAWMDKQKEIFARLDDASSESERKEIMHEYHLWEQNYPMSDHGEAKKSLRLARIRKQLKELKEEEKSLLGEDDE